MPTFSYKGYDFDVDHTPSEDEFAQMSAYVDTLPPKQKKDESSFLGEAGKAIAGAAETGLNLGAMALKGAAAGIATPIQAGVAALKGEPFDFQKTLASNMELEPTQLTEKGPEYLEKAGEFINRNLIPLAPMMHTIPQLTPKGNLTVSRSAKEVPGVDSLITDILKPEEAPVQAPRALPEGIPKGTPLERMAQELGAEPPITPKAPLEVMAEQLGNREQASREALSFQKADAAQEILDQRQAEMELKVKKQATLDFNAAERARQEEAPVLPETQSPDIPFNFKKQGGGILFDFGKKDKTDKMGEIPGLGERLKRNLLQPETAEEAIKSAEDAKDIDQNTFQKANNYLTKGGTYQALKLDNPVVSFTADKILKADNATRAQIRDVVTDNLAPKMRELSQKERTEAWQLMLAAEGKRDLVRTDMENAKMSAKQIDLIESMKTQFDSALTKLNEVRASIGKAPIERRTGYLASMFSGDYRAWIMDAEGKPISAIGATTQKGLNKLTETLKAEHPDWQVGPTRFMGGKARVKNHTGQFNEIMQYLSDNDPNAKALYDSLDKALKAGLYDYMNAKKHTLGKKGIEGSVGNQFWKSPDANANEGMKAQLSYLETIMRWSEMAKASKEIREVLASDKLNMPQAKELSDKLLNHALGNNITELGAALDNATAMALKATGLGRGITGSIIGEAKRFTNLKLLGLNPGFYLANLIQPLKNAPEFKAILNKMGDTRFDAGTGASIPIMGMYHSFVEKKGTPTAFQKKMYAYAKDNHVFSSDMAESSTAPNKGYDYRMNQIGNFITGPIEAGTRKTVFYGLADALHNMGEPRALELAQKMTDMWMNNYSKVEAPMLYGEMGPAGNLAANLRSFMHNELSRRAYLGREGLKTGTWTPFMAAIASDIAFAGMTGVLAYDEANDLVKLISSKVFKNPMSLNELIIDKMPDYLSHGAFSLFGVDMSKRLGVSDVIPNDLSGALLGGATSLYDTAKSIGTAVTDPTEFNVKKAIRDTAPLGVTGIIDRAWFSKTNPETGEEHGINLRSMQPQPSRDAVDMFWKRFSMTGIHESKEKAKAYDYTWRTQQQNQILKDTITDMRKELFTKQEISGTTMLKYIEKGGDADQLDKLVDQMVQDQSIPQEQAITLKLAASDKLPKVKALQRYLNAK